MPCENYGMGFQEKNLTKTAQLIDSQALDLEVRDSNSGSVLNFSLAIRNPGKYQDCNNCKFFIRSMLQLSNVRSNVLITLRT